MRFSFSSDGFEPHTQYNSSSKRKVTSGGNGHWNGDGYCNDGNVPASSIDMGISMLFIVAIGSILFLKYRVS